MDNLGLNDTEVITLTSSTPKASEREKWMHKKAKEGMKIMLCNPRLCETGLDFCWMDDGVEYNYPTLFFYQCGYSLFVTWQAAGRHWRLNQRRECRTYYLAYEGTVQQAILQVLGEKKSATAAIQGHFSAAGLSAMARGVDTQARIAEIMASMDETSGNRLQEMFDVVSDNKGADNYGSVKKMKLFKELIKKVKEEKKENPDLFNDEAFGAFDSIFSKFLREESGEEGEDLFSEFEEMMEQMSDPFTEPKTDSTRKKKVKNYSNCFSLF
jgi:hypothetical protein